MPPIDPNQQGKDLKDFQKLPRSPLASYMMRASEFRNTLAAFEPTAIFQWVTEYLGNRIGRRHKFNHYDNSSPDSGIYQLADDSSIGGAHDPKREIRMSIAGDWGTSECSTGSGGWRICRAEKRRSQSPRPACCRICRRQTPRAL